MVNKQAEDRMPAEIEICRVDLHVIRQMVLGMLHVMLLDMAGGRQMSR